MVLKVWGVLRIRIKLMLTPWQHLGELGGGEVDMLELQESLFQKVI